MSVQTVLTLMAVCSLGSFIAAIVLISRIDDLIRLTERSLGEQGAQTRLLRFGDLIKPAKSPERPVKT
jgi:hypothetical protein